MIRCCLAGQSCGSDHRAGDCNNAERFDVGHPVRHQTSRPDWQWCGSVYSYAAYKDSSNWWDQLVQLTTLRLPPYRDLYGYAQRMSWKPKWCSALVSPPMCMGKAALFSGLVFILMHLNLYMIPVTIICIFVCVLMFVTFISVFISGIRNLRMNKKVGGSPDYVAGGV